MKTCAGMQPLRRVPNAAPVGVRSHSDRVARGFNGGRRTAGELLRAKILPALHPPKAEIAEPLGVASHALFAGR
jgi:hypothetical protein